MKINSIVGIMSEVGVALIGGGELNIIVILCSFIVSTIISVVVMRNKQRKWLALLAALMVNVILLGTAYWLLYSVDRESQLFGIDFQDRYLLVAFIPVVTILNYIILSFDIKLKKSEH